MPDRSVRSSNLCTVAVHICGLTAFHSVRCLFGLLLSNQSGPSYVRGCSLVGDCHHVTAAWEGNMLTGHEFLQSSELCSTALKYPRALEFAPGSRPREFLRLRMSCSFLSYLLIFSSIPQIGACSIVPDVCPCALALRGLGTCNICGASTSQTVEGRR